VISRFIFRLNVIFILQQGAAGGMPDMDKLFEAFESNPEMTST
jgi:hypothetical protein